MFDISAGGLLIPQGIIRPLVSVSALTWFITYIFIIGNYRSYIFNTSGLKLSWPYLIFFLPTTCKLFGFSRKHLTLSVLYVHIKFDTYVCILLSIQILITLGNILFSNLEKDPFILSLTFITTSYEWRKHNLSFCPVEL